MTFGDDSQTQEQDIGEANNGNIIQINGNGNIIALRPEDIDRFEKQSILNNTIKYILEENNFTFDFAEAINIPTELDKKIDTNKINSSLKEYLVSGRAKRYLIDELIDDNQEYSIEDLRKDVLKIYDRHYKSFDDMNTVIQKTYIDLLNKFDKNNAELSISIFIIISYFFEICDIGDNPNDSAK